MRHSRNFLIAAIFTAVLGAGSTVAQGQKLTTIYSFTGQNSGGEIPFSPLLFGARGSAYGTTSVGGTETCGTVFKLTPPAEGKTKWIESSLYDFDCGLDGQQPNDVLFDQKGNIFDTTLLGGNGNCFQGCGTIFELSPPPGGKGAWTHTVLYNFAGGDDGAGPGNLEWGLDGALYGTTGGTIFSFSFSAGAWTKTILHSFPSSKNDGKGANYDIIIDSKGNIFGTTYEGGNGFYGTVFELSPPTQKGGAWVETILYNFTGSSDGGYPIGGLTFGNDSVIYGTASYSGVPNRSGAAFSLTPPADAGTNWAYKVTHTFSEKEDVATPATTMAIDAKGNLYGTAWNGGSQSCYDGCGGIFKLAPGEDGTWKETILHEWGNSKEDPNGSIVTLHDGLLYGTSEFFGPNDVGTIFTLTP
jgi:hypothetical protein